MSKIVRLKNKPAKNKIINNGVLNYLERTDKWYLGGGNRLTWAPPFPVWLDYPGFWDKAHYYNREIEPIFTWTILDDEGVEIPLRARSRKWDPSKLVTRFEMSRSEGGAMSIKHRPIAIEEIKCCLPNDVLASVVQIKNNSKKNIKIHLVAWTVQPNYPSKKTTWLDRIDPNNHNLTFKKYLQPHHPHAPTLPVECSFGLDRTITSFGVNLSEGTAVQPHWKFTPFIEKFRTGKLPNECKITGVTNEGLMFMALHSSLELQAHGQDQISVFFSVAPTPIESRKNISVAVKSGNAGTLSTKNWNNYFSTIPYFECSDEYFTRYYWYRWYGLKLLTIDVKEGNYHRPFVCEGIGYFRAPISYSSICHMLENRWLPDPSLAQGSLLTFLDNQREDGGFRGYIDVDFHRQEMFYHANWGNSLLELHRLHPDKNFLKKAYTGLVKYVEYYDRERDAEGSGLYDIDNHYETGQEYMHRYIAINPNADQDNWGEIFRLKGVDVTIYMYEMKRTLSVVAGILGDLHGQERWDRGADAIKQAVQRKMWDPKQQIFFDVNPKTGKGTNVKAATCFYPYMTDIAEKEHLAGIKSHLFNTREFWTSFPVPSSSIDDRYFCSEAEWKKKRMNCPWNGRVWPMTNSHIAEALAQTAIRFNDSALRKKSVEFMTRYLRMMFFDGDPQRPNCFEHYNPFTGQPSVYRGVDDYQHSWVADLIIKYICGVRGYRRDLIIDPFPFPLEMFVLDNIIVRGKRIAVRRFRETFSVFVSGKKKADSKIGQPVVIENL